jgi:dTDP-glucose 4,6-dehydratase
VRVLVTGGAGFIGSNLIRLLVRSGHQVLNYDKLTYAGNSTSLTDLANQDSYELCVADVCDRAAVMDAFQRFQPQWVAHLAAESHVDRSIDGPDAFVQTNVVGTYTMLNVATEYRNAAHSAIADDFRFLHVSTDEVFGSLDSTGKFTEASSYSPNSPYSASKAASDHFVRAWHKTFGLPVLITNCSNNYGPFQFPEKLIPLVILKAIQGELIPVYGTGENVRDWLYVEDHCNAIELVLREGRVGETYNIGGNNESRNIDLVVRLCRVLDRLQPRSDGKLYEQQIEFVSDRPGHDFRYAIDASKIQAELNWRPSQDLESGLEKTVRWYLDNVAWCDRIFSGEYRLQRLGLLES